MNLSEKNILFLTHSYASFQKDQIELLSQYFRHVYVLVRYKPIAEISRWLPINSLRIHRKKYVLQLLNKPKNVTVIPVPLYYFPTEKGYLNLGEPHFKKALHIIQQYNISFDLIHAHFLWSAGFVGSALKKIYKVPFVVTAHGYDIYSLPFKNKKWFQRIKDVSLDADSVITVSKYNEFYAKKLDVSNCHIVPNGFNKDLFYIHNKTECRKKLNLSKNKTIVLSIGNLTQVKGHTFLIESIREVVRNIKNVLFIIIGNGGCYASLKMQIANLDLDGYVMMVGEKKHHEVPVWINSCDLFVLPSLSESFGIVQLEAMACGKPVVATMNGGSESVITSQDVGLLCEKANPQDLAEKILIALERSWDEKKIIKYAQQYTLDEVCKKIVALYQNVLIS